MRLIPQITNLYEDAAVLHELYKPTAVVAHGFRVGAACSIDHDK